MRFKNASKLLTPTDSRHWFPSPPLPRRAGLYRLSATVDIFVVTVIMQLAPQLPPRSLAAIDSCTTDRAACWHTPSRSRATPDRKSHDRQPAGLQCRWPQSCSDSHPRRRRTVQYHAAGRRRPSELSWRTGRRTNRRLRLWRRCARTVDRREMARISTDRSREVHPGYLLRHLSSKKRIAVDDGKVK